VNVQPLLLPGSYWCCLLYCLVFYCCCLRYCLDPIGARSATAWILLVLPPALPGILLVLPAPLPGILCTCSAALLPGIQLVLPVLVITAMPVDYRIKERNVRMHLPTFKKKLVNNRSKHFVLLSWNYLHLKSYAYLPPVKHIINYKYNNYCFNRLYRLFLAGRSSEG
jgi:hypothetical protein